MVRDQAAASAGSRLAERCFFEMLASVPAAMIGKWRNQPDGR